MEFNGSDSSLTHWGIKGQKWGIRRYQNDDGSYTPAGRERYYQSKENYRTLKKSGASETDIAKAKRQMKSDKDLYKRAKRAEKGAELLDKGKGAESESKKAIAATAIALSAIGGTLLSTQLIKANKAKTLIKARDFSNSTNRKFRKMYPGGMPSYYRSLDHYREMSKNVNKARGTYLNKLDALKKAEKITSKVNRYVPAGIGVATAGYVIKKNKNVKDINTAKRRK